MNRFHSLKLRLRAGAGPAMVATVIYAASIAFVAGADTNAPPAKVVDSKAEKTTEKKVSTKKLTGAELYASTAIVATRNGIPPIFTSASGRHS